MKVHRSNQELQDTIEGYKMLIEEQKKEIWKLKQTASDPSVKEPRNCCKSCTLMNLFLT